MRCASAVTLRAVSETKKLSIMTRGISGDPPDQGVDSGRLGQALHRPPEQAAESQGAHTRTRASTKERQQLRIAGLLICAPPPFSGAGPRCDPHHQRRDTLRGSGGAPREGRRGGCEGGQGQARGPPGGSGTPILAFRAPNGARTLRVVRLYALMFRA